MMRIALDARRQRDNGVARVTRLLATALSGLPVELVLLGRPESLRAQFPQVENVAYDAPLLSPTDLHGMNSLLNSLHIDCFVAPQFYNSARTECPQVRLLHDTFPLEAYAKLTNISNVESTFGRDNVAAVANALLGEGRVPRSSLAARLYRAYYVEAAAKATTIFTVSEQSRADIVRHFRGTTRKLKILPLFADKTVVSTPVAVQDRYYHALHVSKFEPRKNQLVLLAAWREIWKRDRSFHACIVGSPSSLFPDYSRELLTKIEGGERDGWLTWAREINDPQLAFLYKSTKVVCVPSTKEGFGLPALEAISNGCIVLALRGTAVDEVCGPTVVHSSNSAAAIAESVSSLLALTEVEQARRSAEARARSEMFSVDRTREALHEALLNAVRTTPYSD